MYGDAREAERGTTMSLNSQPINKVGAKEDCSGAVGHFQTQGLKNW